MAHTSPDDIDRLQPSIVHRTSPVNLYTLMRRCSSTRIAVSFDEMIAEIATTIRLNKHVKSVRRDGYILIVTWKRRLPTKNLWRAEQDLDEAVEIVYQNHRHELRLNK